MVLVDHTETLAFWEYLAGCQQLQEENQHPDRPEGVEVSFSIQSGYL